MCGKTSARSSVRTLQNNCTGVKKNVQKCTETDNIISKHIYLIFVYIILQNFVLICTSSYIVRYYYYYYYYYYYLSLLLSNLAIFLILNFICIFLVSMKLGFH